MTTKLSKSKFKPQALEYFRQVEETGETIVITDRGRPVIKIVPFVDDPAAALAALRGTVVSYENPTEPVGVKDWESLG
jgi:prevent-host-death family protein